MNCKTEKIKGKHGYSNCRKKPSVLQLAEHRREAGLIWPQKLEEDVAWSWAQTSAEGRWLTGTDVFEGPFDEAHGIKNWIIGVNCSCWGGDLLMEGCGQEERADRQSESILPVPAFHLLSGSVIGGNSQGVSWRSLCEVPAWVPSQNRV